jgi:hypothetical protein
LKIGDFQILGMTSTNVTLSNIVITGFPNVTAPAERMIMAPPTLRLTLLLGSLQAGTSATATFSASYGKGSKLEFGITVKIRSVPLTAVITPGGADASELMVTFNPFDFQIPAESMGITLSDQTGFAPAVQKVLNQTAIQQKIAAAIKNQFNNHLTAISDEVTKQIRALLNEQLGGN